MFSLELLDDRDATVKPFLLGFFLSASGAILGATWECTG